MTNGTAQIWKRVVIGYVIALHLFTVVLVAKTNFIAKFKGKFLNEPVVPVVPPSPHVKNMLVYLEWMDENVPDRSVIFLGDSITKGLAVAAVAPYATNYGVGGETTAELLDAMPSYKSLNRVTTIFLAIGINDLNQSRKEGLNERYRKIVAALPHKTPLIWSSVMPTTIKHISQIDIIEANLTIKALCEDRGNCFFVDTWSFLTNKSGQMIQDYFLADGIHLSPNGYKVWIAALKEANQHVTIQGKLRDKATLRP